MWHPEENIGFGYAMDSMELTPWNARGLVLQEEVWMMQKRAVFSVGSVTPCLKRHASLILTRSWLVPNASAWGMSKQVPRHFSILQAVCAAVCKTTIWRKYTRV